MTGRRLLLVLSAVSLLSIGGCAASQPSSYSNAGTSAEPGFYDGLSQYGTWENVPVYGDCWVPLDVPAGWRPYTVGYWEATDYGWMWVSQDPWGGIPYHYGRWAEDDTYGWIWVPDDDYVWAPAWVAWRYGDGYVGWAPLPPDVGWQSGIGLSVSVSDLDQRTARDSWCFSMVRDFGATRISASVLPPSRNVTLISRTTNVTRYEVVDSRPAERGLSVEILERDTGRRFPRYLLVDSRSPSNLRGNRARGQTIEVYRPPVTELRTRPVRPTPQEQQGPSRAMIQRLDAEQRQFGQRMQQERAALGREQERELKQQGKAGSPIDQLRQLHQAEMQAQQDREGREQRALDQRRKIIQKMQSSQGPGKDKSQGKGHDKGQGRDKGKSEGQGKGQSDNPDQGKERGKGHDQGTSGN
jgi:hypothetical protein